MPRTRSVNTIQITLNVPEEWVEEAEALAKKLSEPGMAITRADAFRVILAKGFEAVRKKK